MVDPRSPVRLTLGERVGIWTIVHPRLFRLTLIVFAAAIGALGVWAFR